MRPCEDCEECEDYGPVCVCVIAKPERFWALRRINYSPVFFRVSVCRECSVTNKPKFVILQQRNAELSLLRDK